MSLKSHAAALAAAVASLATLGAAAPAAHADLITPILSCAYPLVGTAEERIQFTSNVATTVPLRGVPAPTFTVTAAYGVTDGTQQSGPPAAAWQLLGATSLEGYLEATVGLSGAGVSAKRRLTFPIPKTDLSTTPGEHTVLQGTATHPSVTYSGYGPAQLSFDDTAPVTLHLLARRADGTIIQPPPSPQLPDDFEPETFDIACTTRNATGSWLIDAFQVLHTDPPPPTTPPTTPPGPLKPVILGLAPNHGPLEGGNEVIVEGVFAGIGELRSVTFGGKPATVISQETLRLVVKAPTGPGNGKVDVVVNSANGSSENTAADDYTYTTIACACLDYRYAVSGSATLKTLAKGTVPLTGLASDGLIDLQSGAFSFDLALDRASAKLVALGFLPVTAQLEFVSQSRMTGTLRSAILTGSQKVRIKLPKVSLFGLQLVGNPNTCQAKSASNVAYKSTDFDPLSGGTLPGTFAISDLTGCGALTGLVSSLTAGKNNAIALKLTAQG